MGTHVHLVVDTADAPLLATAWSRIQDLEARWSRFLPTSELSRLNGAAGRPVIVSAATFDLVALAVEGWRATEGRFDPTVHDALVAAGYDRTFAELDLLVPASPASPAPGAAEIGLDPELRAVTLPPGLRLDLGGVGKGAAADLVCDELLAAGAAGACVSIGGDVRVAGLSPLGRAWPLTLPVDGGAPRRLDLIDGGACTSTTRRRRWASTLGPAHHIIDPRTGRPTTSDLTTVTVCAQDAARAEILTKSAFVLGRERATAHLEGLGLDAVLVDTAGRLVEIGRLACQPA